MLFLRIYKNQKKFSAKTKTIPAVPLALKNGNFKIIISDFTQKLKPDRNCSTEMCKEILNNINSAKTSIDFAIYGYSSVPSIATCNTLMSLFSSILNV